MVVAQPFRKNNVVMLLTITSSIVSTVAATSVNILDDATATLEYDGHGALSAGASSRLLYVCCYINICYARI